MNLLISPRVVSSKDLDLEKNIILKLAENKTSLGPILRKPRQTRDPGSLSNSANFARIIAKGSLSPLKEREENKESIAPKGVIIFNNETSIDALKADIVALSYWDENKVPNETSNLQSRRLAYYTRRNEVYTELGYDPNSISKNNRPELSSDQLLFYNTELAKYSVPYWEYHLALNIPGYKKWIRSKTFRSLERIRPETALKQLGQWVESDSKNFGERLKGLTIEQIAQSNALNTHQS